MTFEHLDDPQPFVPDPEFRAAAQREGRRRRDRRRLQLGGGSLAMLLLVFVAGFLAIRAGGEAPDDRGRVYVPSVPSTVLPATTTVAPVPAPDSTVTTAPGSTSTSRPQPATHQEPYYFHTPSGNIGCEVGESAARCDILSWTYAVPAVPTDCNGDWGTGAEVAVGSSAALRCNYDTVGGQGDPLDYGHAVRVGQVTCLSQESGVTCRTDDGHGFLLSKERYELQ